MRRLVLLALAALIISVSGVRAEGMPIDDASPDIRAAAITGAVVAAVVATAVAATAFGATVGTTVGVFSAAHLAMLIAADGALRLWNEEAPPAGPVVSGPLLRPGS